MAKHAIDYYETTDKKGRKRTVMSFDVFKSLSHDALVRALNIRSAIAGKRGGQ